MLRGVGIVVLLLAGGAGADPKYPDKPVKYHFDLTRDGDKKPTILAITMPPKVWQHGDHPPGWAPGTAVRKGWGTAWWYIDDPQEPGAGANAYLEIEELGKRKLKQAVQDAIADLVDVCKRAKCTLLSPPGKPKRLKKLRLGRKRVDAYEFEYRVSPPAIHGSGVFTAKSLLFALNKHLVTLTVHNAGRNNLFDAFAGKIELVKKRSRERPFPFKLFLVDGGISRFLTLEVPSGFRREYGTLADQKLAAVFEGPRTRFMVRETAAHRQPLRDIMEKRATKLRTQYEEFDGPKELKISGRAAFQVSFRHDETRVRMVHARISNLDYTLIWETELDQSLAFDRVLGSARIWRSRVR